MSERDDGGSAFPRYERSTEWRDGPQQYVDVDHAVVGMSLRDYFAAKAMPALIGIGESLGSINADDLAADAYKYADAMLEARKK